MPGLQNSNPELRHLTQASMEQLKGLDMQDDLKKKLGILFPNKKEFMTFQWV